MIGYFCHTTPMHRRCIHVAPNVQRRLKDAATAPSKSTSKKPSKAARNKTRPEPAFRSHPVWKKASVWVPRNPRRPKEQPEDESAPLHPLLLRDKQLPGEWEPTPPKGVDFSRLKRLLLKERPSSDQSLQAITESTNMTISDDVDWIEMSFSPGTLIEVRR